MEMTETVLSLLACLKVFVEIKFGFCAYNLPSISKLRSCTALWNSSASNDPSDLDSSELDEFPELTEK